MTGDRRSPDDMRSTQTQPMVSVLLPCGHRSKGPPVSSTKTAHFYRCSQGCEMQKVTRRGAL